MIAKQTIIGNQRALIFAHTKQSSESGKAMTTF